MIRFAYLGNFEPAWSTENEVRAALEAEGHHVTPIQEGTLTSDVPRMVAAAEADVFLWTQTKSLAEKSGTVEDRAAALKQIAGSVPTVGAHLDRWWGLSRQMDVYTEPFFRCDVVFTADGHHVDQWADAGVNHVWWPPAVGHRHLDDPPAADPGRFAADVAFVGSWQGGYHREWGHRRGLVRHLRSRWGARMFPEAGQPAVRGFDLASLYATVKVAVGDSCLVPGLDGRVMSRYCSDRIPETLGRGGLLIHPRVEGVTDSLFVEGMHLACWTLGDFAELDEQIEFLLDSPDVAAQIASDGRAHVRAYHTYRNRVRAVVAHLRTKGWL